MNLFIGTSGYNYKDWKERFYPTDIPQKKWLSYYAKYFNTVEINATFYRQFPNTVFGKWHDETPANFSFSIKGSRFITHIKRLNDISKPLKIFFDSAFSLKEKLSIVLWQFPASFKNNEENLRRLTKFLSFPPKKIRQTFEFRHNSWFTEKIYNLLNKKNAGFVNNDTNAFPTKKVITGDFVYIRFHGPSYLYSSSYSNSELKDWAKKIKKYSKKYDVYCYFNNDFSTHAIRNAQELIELTV